MDLQQRLGAFQARELIDEHIVQTVLNVRCHLQQDWLADVETEQVKMMLVHLASALGRIQRGHCVSPLYADFLAEIQSAVVFPDEWQAHNALAIHYTKFPTDSFRARRSRFYGAQTYRHGRRHAPIPAWRWINRPRPRRE